MSLREILLNENALSCTWAAENKNICDSVTWGKSYSSDLEAVSVDTCVLLNRGDGSQGCQSEIRFMLLQNLRVARITAVSDARTVEVYGACGEYVGTQSADFVDEFEDMSVYAAEVVLPEPLSECVIRFAGLKTSDQMWLYGIHLTVQEAPSSAPPGRLIDFQNVSHMLERSGCKLSEKAERCQSFLEAYASSTDSLLPAEVTELLKTLETHYTTNGERDRSLTDLLSRFSSSPRLANNNFEAPQDTEHCASTHKSPNELGNIGTLSKALCSLKDYIDQRFAQSEKLLLTRVDEKFKELEARQSEKLDLILQQLKVLNMPHNGTMK